MRLRTRPTAADTPAGGPARRPADLGEPTPPASVAGRRHRSGGGELYRRMLVRDVQRNRGVTVILVVLMMLSVLLATASAGTLTRLLGGASDLMARAAAPDVLQMHIGALDQEELDRWVAARPEVEYHQTMPTLVLDGASLAFDGELQTESIQQNALVVPNQERDLLLDLDDVPITAVDPGSIVLPVIYQVQDGLQVGDPVRITAADGFAMELSIAGFARDSIMNPAIASSKRLAVAASDLEAVREHTGTDEYLIEFWLQPDASSAAFQKAYLDAGMPQGGQMVDAATFRMLTTIGDGMATAGVILVSALLLLVGLLCLRFSFQTAAEEDYREIGVLKAIGVAPRDIRRVYLVKYAALAAVASVLGLLGGLALTPVLTRKITRYLGTAPSVWNWVVPIATALVGFVVLVLFVLVLLRRFRRISPVAALRSGATSQPRRAARLRLHRSRMPVQVRLGTMDVVGRWSTYLLLFTVFAVSAFIVIVPVNSATTATAPDFLSYMGVGPVDLRVDLRVADEDSDAAFAAMIETLEADPDVAAIAPMVTTRNDTIDQDGNAASLYIENGDHTRLPLTYADGRAPTDATEIALSLLARYEAGRDVGDTLPVEVGGEVQELRIVGTYQDITNGGRTAKSVLPTEDDEVMWYTIGIELAPGADASAAATAYGERFAPATVATIDHWRTQTIGPIARQVTGTAVVAAIVAIALAMLITALFVRMLLARDAGQIAIQRAIGADDGGLRQQYLTRTLLVLVLGIVVGTVLANTLGERMFNLMFESMYGGFETLGQGTSRIDFAVRPLLAYLLLPATLLAAVTAATFVSSRSIATAELSSLTTE